MVAVAAVGLGTVSAQTPNPTVALDRTGTAAGETMLVTGAGWPAGNTLIVELCGHGGLRGTVDCDVAQQRTAGVGSSGTFGVELTSGLPPASCPCVVKATDQTTQIAATAPIAVAGIATVPLTADDVAAVRAIEISSMKITGGGHWAELFGAGGRRVLEITLVNTGPLAIDAPDVSVVWGKGSHPDGFVTPPQTKRLEPGATQTLTVALRRPALTLGQQTAVVDVQGLATPVTARATTSAYPWGLLALALLALQGLLLRIRNRVRRRVTRATEPDPNDPLLAGAALELGAARAALGAGPGGAPADHDTVVIDLDEIGSESVAPPSPQPAARSGPGLNGVTQLGLAHGHGQDLVVAAPRLVPGSAIERQRGELDLVQQQARAALDQAAELSGALVAATAARVRALEEQTIERLHSAEARHTESLELLSAARTQAGQLIAEASEGAAAMLREATSTRDAAQHALAEIHEQRALLLDAASEAVDEVLRELDEHVQSLVAADAGQTADAVPAAPELSPPPPAPRLGGLDARLAHAVSQAFAATSADRTTTD